MPEDVPHLTRWQLQKPLIPALKADSPQRGRMGGLFGYFMAEWSQETGLLKHHQPLTAPAIYVIADQVAYTNGCGN